jgi:hypothetical protein
MLEVEKTFDFLIGEWLRFKSMGWHKMANQCYIAALAHYERYMNTKA